MLKKIKLQNWKSHSEAELDFRRGVNVIVGPMGSGKSSVLQAICFALFGSVPEVKRREVKVSELIKRNSNSDAKVELELESGGTTFLIDRSISPKGTEATIRNAEGVLLAGTNPTQATAFVKNILKLDQDTFLRTVYARQNEIDFFLQLNPQERKRRLDELMGVHKFETARKNCVRLLNKLQTKKDAKNSILKNFELGELNKAISKLREDIKSSQDEQNTLANSLVQAQKEKSETETLLENIKAKFDAFTRLEEKQKFLVARVNEICLKLKEPVESQAKIKSQLEELRNNLATTENKVSILSKKNEDLNKALMASEKDTAVAESKLADVLARLEKFSELKNKLAEAKAQLGITEPEKQLDAVCKELEVLKTSLSSKESELRLLSKHLEDLKSARGACPTCARELDQQTKESLVKEREKSIALIREQISAYSKKYESLEATRAKLQNFLEQSKNINQQLEAEAELLQQKASLEDELIKHKDKIRAIKQELAQVKLELREYEKKMGEYHNEELRLREQLHFAELKEQRQQLEAQLAEVRTKLATKPDSAELRKAEQNFQTALTKYEQLSARERTLKFVIEEKNKRLVELQKKQKQADQIIAELEDLDKKIEFLQQFKGALLSAQELLRKELITAVNEVMSSLWGKLYPYAKWDAVRLAASESDYTLQLRTPEGDWANVAGFASGGERMLAALALRLAFAKVLAPEFNILILDEPTHNLDQAAIETLILALQEHLSEFLEQLIIVTHEEKLTEVGDNIVRLNL